MLAILVDPMADVWMASVIILVLVRVDSKRTSNLCQPRFRDHPSPHLLICRIQVERENQRMLDLRRVNHSIALIQEGNELVEI